MKSESCELCGCHLTDILQVHHIIPMSAGGSCEEGNLIVLCPNCHILVHKCVDQGGINDSIRDCYEAFGVVGKLEWLVKKGIGDD